MLDLILAPLLEYTNLGKYTHKVEKDGKSKEELWYSSATNITFGDSNTWLIGLGRTTNICGPEIKVVADWTFIEELISKKMEHYPITQALLFGVGGASDVLFGVKNLINYGDTQDATVIRKQTAPLEIKIFKGESLFPTDLVLLIVLPYLLLLTMVVTIRFANMQVGVFAEESTREKVAKALSVLAPLVESRWIALLLVYEKLTYTADQLEKSKAKLNNDVVEFKKTFEANLDKLTAQAKNVLITGQLKKDIDVQFKIIKEYLKDSASHSEKEVRDAMDALKASAPFLGNPHEEHTVSNFPLDSSYHKLTYNAIEAIQLNAEDASANVKSKSSFNLTPTALNFEAPGTLFQFGKIGSQEGSINISFSGSENNAFMKLGADGSSLSNMTIQNDTLLIQSGKTNNKNPTIELKEGSLMLRCGPAFIGPEILITDTEVKIKVGADVIGSSFVMTSNSIELEVGPLSALKITSDGVEIKCGPASYTKWDAKSIDMAAAENKIKLGLIELQENAVMLKQNTVLAAEIKAMLLTLKGAPALKLDAPIKIL